MCLCFLLGSDLKSYRQKHKVCLSTEIIPGLSMGEMLCPFSVCVFRMFWYTRVLHDLQAKEMDCYLQLKGVLNVGPLFTNKIHPLSSVFSWIQKWLYLPQARPEGQILFHRILHSTLSARELLNALLSTYLFPQMVLKSSVTHTSAVSFSAVSLQDACCRMLTKSVGEGNPCVKPNSILTLWECFQCHPKCRSGIWEREVMITRLFFRLFSGFPEHDLGMFL